MSSTFSGVIDGIGKNDTFGWTMLECGKRNNLSLMVACDRDRYFLDRDSVCSQSPWFAHEIRSNSRTLADISGFAMTCLTLDDAQNDIPQYVVSYLETGQYPPTDILLPEPWIYLVQHIKVYNLALRFQLPALEALAVAAFQNGIIDGRPDLLDHYIDSLHLMSTLSDFGAKNNITCPPSRSTLKACAAYGMARLSGELLDNANFRYACREDSNFRVFLLHAIAYDKSLEESSSGKLLQAYLENAELDDRSAIHGSRYLWHIDPSTNKYRRRRWI